MATATSKKEVAVVGVELTLTPDEAKTLADFLAFGGDPAEFRRKNPGLYDLLSALTVALA